MYYYTHWETAGRAWKLKNPFGNGFLLYYYRAVARVVIRFLQIDVKSWHQLGLRRCTTLFFWYMRYLTIFTPTWSEQIAPVDLCGWSRNIPGTYYWMPGMNFKGLQRSRSSVPRVHVVRFPIGLLSQHPSTGVQMAVVSVHCIIERPLVFFVGGRFPLAFGSPLY